VLVDADAPPASESDNPAAPNTGTALLRRFRFEACFELAILDFSRTFEHLAKQSAEPGKAGTNFKAPQFHKKTRDPGRQGYGRGCLGPRARARCRKIHPGRLTSKLGSSHIVSSDLRHKHEAFMHASILILSFA
jgi:hypothetical protein